MRAELKDLHVSAALIGRGGDRSQMTYADWGRIGGLLRHQYRYLQRYAEVVQQRATDAVVSHGQVPFFSEKYLQWRSRLYGGNATATFYLGMVAGLLDQVPGDGKNQCRTNCKCSLRFEPGEHPGQILVWWELNPAEHCDDCVHLSQTWNPLEIWLPGSEPPEAEGEGGPGEDGPNEGGPTPSDADLQRMAQELYSKAAAVEPGITTFLREQVEGAGGEMHGLEYRLKGLDSIVSKIRREAAETGLPYAEAAQGITDLVRYTAVLSPDLLVERATQIQRELASQGWEQYDTKWRNYYAPGNTYNGYNCVFWNPRNGLAFELQFHTGESLEIKEQVHLIYQQAREMGPGPERDALIERMRGMWIGYQRPAGWNSLAGVLITGY